MALQNDGSVRPQVLQSHDVTADLSPCVTPKRRRNNRQKDAIDAILQGRRERQQEIEKSRLDFEMQKFAQEMELRRLELRFQQEKNESEFRIRLKEAERAAMDRAAEMAIRQQELAVKQHEIENAAKDRDRQFSQVQDEIKIKMMKMELLLSQVQNQK